MIGDEINPGIFQRPNVMPRAALLRLKDLEECL
jgi:hypothetical protein